MICYSNTIRKMIIISTKGNHSYDRVLPRVERMGVVWAGFVATLKNMSTESMVGHYAEKGLGRKLYDNVGHTKGSGQQVLEPWEVWSLVWLHLPAVAHDVIDVVRTTVGRVHHNAIFKVL